MKSEQLIMYIYFVPILIMPTIFGILYYFFLKIKAKRKKSVIIAEQYLPKLFVRSKDVIDAVKGKNDEIDVEDVIFDPVDFNFHLQLEELNKPSQK